jgi:hypothetical protein
MVRGEDGMDGKRRWEGRVPEKAFGLKARGRRVVAF